MHKTRIHSIAENPQFRLAKVPEHFDKIKVLIGSEEKIFGDVFVTGVINNNRVAKFRKNTLDFSK